MFAQKKIVKEKGLEAEPFELDVAQALCDLEANSNDLKAELLGLNLDAKGRKPDLARRLADHRIRQTHGRGGGTEHGGEGEGEEGAIKIETVPAHSEPP